jgi:hypothetical protein
MPLGACGRWLSRSTGNYHGQHISPGKGTRRRTRLDKLDRRQLYQLLGSYTVALGVSNPNWTCRWFANCSEMLSIMVEMSSEMLATESPISLAKSKVITLRSRFTSNQGTLCCTAALLSESVQTKSEPSWAGIRVQCSCDFPSLVIS